MEQESGAPKGNFGIKLIFILFGVASLLGWNALITELPFFNYFLGSMEPDVSFPFLNYILNILFLFLMLWKKDLFSLKFQLVGGIIGSIIFLIIIPVCTMFLGKDENINIYTTGTLVVLMGFINAICSGGFFNFVSYFPLEMIVALSTGQGFSGIALNILQYMVLVLIKSEGEKDEKAIIIRAWVFFGISSLILIICLILLFIYLNNEYFVYYLNKAIIGSSKTDNKLLERESDSEGKLSVDNEEKKDEKELSFMELFYKLWDLDILVAYTYVVTFALFPYASINQQVFGLDNDYSTNTAITIYNVFDTIGRYIVEKVKPTKKLNAITILGRSILLFTLIFNFYCQDGLLWNINITSILLIINVAFLAMTNGIGTTLCFGLAPNEVEDEYKGQAGISLSFFLIIGIFLGSCVAFGTEAIINTFKIDRSKSKF